MIAYFLRRFGALVIALFALSILVSLLIHMIPGDPAEVIAGMGSTWEDVERIRIKLGLDQPVYTQYIHWLSSILKGDLGTSAITRQPIADMIGFRLLNTLKLAFAGIILATVCGVMAGVIGALWHNTALDYVVTICAVLGVAIPIFWLGLLLVVVFVVNLGWFPAGGTGGIRYLVLPAIAIGANSTAIIARITRSSMLEVLRKDYIRTAMAKGLKQSYVVLRHGLRNASIPIVTSIGLQFGMLMGGAVLTESVFDWSGIGRLLVDAVFKRDFPLVQVLLLVFGGIFAMTNLVVDLLYSVIDPRILYK